MNAPHRGENHSLAAILVAASLRDAALDKDKKKPGWWSSRV
jgi:hypothetical protein